MGKWWGAGAAVFVIVALGSLLDVMEVDAAQYASISLDLLSRTDWLQFHWRGQDYLDKPPLLFWSSALSFKLFGVHNWSYKLPSILFAFLGVYATFRFTRLFHTVEVARTAALMFASSAAFFLMTNDVRCDTMLTGAVMTAIWLGAEYLAHHRWRHLLGCAVAIAAGMLAKGPIGLIAPALALGPPLVFLRRWHALLDPRLLIILPVIGCLLLPMCIGLYHQHGMHGLWFYFWGQSFGRITGESPWANDASVFFFTHEVLWQLLPWTLFALLGLLTDLRYWIRNGLASLPEAIALCGAVGVLIVVSMSRYKLPHYIYPILPLLSVIAARQVHRAVPRAMTIAQLVLLIILLAAALLLCARLGAPHGMLWFAVVVMMTLAAGALWWRTRGASRIIWPSLATAFGCGLVLNAFAYPFLLGFQTNAKAGQFAEQHEIPAGLFVSFRTGGSALDFHARTEVPWIGQVEHLKAIMRPGMIVYTDTEGAAMLENAGLRPGSKVELQHYPVQLLDLRFLDPGQRKGMLRPRFLLRY